jgi:acyl-CoA thioesterase II
MSSGDSSIPVVYFVEIVRNGRSFATRTVRALQRGEVIFVLTASFQRLEPSPMSHGMPSPVHLVPDPETIHAPSPDEFAKLIYQRIIDASETLSSQSKASPFITRARENKEEFVRAMSEEFAVRPIDFRYVSRDQVKSDASRAYTTDYRQYVWFKVNGTISSDPRAHFVALAYASDHNLLSTSVRSHGDEWEFKDISVMVSLDHIIYFHEVGPFNSDTYKLGSESG